MREPGRRWLEFNSEILLKHSTKVYLVGLWLWQTRWPNYFILFILFSSFDNYLCLFHELSLLYYFYNKKAMWKWNLLHRFVGGRWGKSLNLALSLLAWFFHGHTLKTVPGNRHKSSSFNLSFPSFVWLSDYFYDYSYDCFR